MCAYHSEDLPLTQQDSSLQARMATLGCCVIIATYNNDATLGKVIDKTLSLCGDVFVVNDGSTDRTSEVLDSRPQLRRIDLRVNSGKGYALRQGFKAAIAEGFRYAITIDSDGQHFPEDIPAFVQLVEQNPDSMIIGARDMEQDSVPGTSSFGHKFSIFWFLVETGIRVPDVQTGFRLYPLHNVAKLGRLFTPKYEFEVEVLVRLAWQGVKILSVPVKVYYAPKEERVSHFRKFRDFTRVSLMNTTLVLIALLWMRPWIFFRDLRKKSFREFLKKYIIDSNDSNGRLAVSVGFGIFMGIIPVWGWQMVLTFSLASFFRLNRFISLVTCNISIPPLLPLILFASYFTGGLILGTGNDGVSYPAGLSFDWVKHNLVQYLVGSLIFGILFGLVSGLISFLLLQIFRKNNSHNGAVIIDESNIRES